MKKTDLGGSWLMTGEDGRSCFAQVPGTVLSTLLEQGEIPDPFDGMNEQSVCAALDKTYTFERDFLLTGEDLLSPHLCLVFEGIDTLADIELNGVLLAHTENMHRTWRFPIRDKALEGANHLKITLYPAVRYVEKAAEENPDVTYEGGSDLKWTGALRKAHYMFGWDWGPRLPDAGIWRDVYIEAYDARLEQVHVHQEHHEGVVDLFVRAETGAKQLRAAVSDLDGKPLALLTVPAGETACIRVEEPRLWWPNGLGDQPLYTLTVQALNENEIMDEKTLRIGLRTMTVKTDRDEWGSEFAFCVNGVRFFAMGADYIPEDNLLTRLTREKTRKLLRICKDSHFNSIRVWGGGIYPGEDFLDLCDEMGLVVWMDLMYACNVYKLTDTFRENIVRETEDNLRRVRHHACLGLICGNNEMEEGWISWDQVASESEELKKQYTLQFEKVLKEVCAKEAPDSFYWPSSPSSGGGFDEPNDLSRGDVHDWSVWHGRRPFSDYTKRYPRFCSEFGFESFPCMDTLNTFIHDEKEMNPFSEVMESHQKCLSGNATMLFYLSQTLRYPFSMEKLVHATQYLQAEAMRAGVEHWRRNRGRCMGAIYWQLNDCWPVASWSSVDSLGRLKALQYEAARFFAPVMISLQPEGKGWKAVIANETREDFSGELILRVCDERGSTLRETRKKVCCSALSSAPVASVMPKDGEEMPVVRCILNDGAGKTVSENEALNALPKHFRFAVPNVKASCEGNTLTVSSDAFCLGVELDAGEIRFSDNWFSLYPGEARVITADRTVDPEKLKLRWLE